MSSFEGRWGSMGKMGGDEVGLGGCGDGIGEGKGRGCEARCVGTFLGRTNLGDHSQSRGLRSPEAYMRGVLLSQASKFLVEGVSRAASSFRGRRSLGREWPSRP